ncbi:MAG: hypothetical protein JO127_01130 [Caulobacteraceae bacterium]|nr:hypothetical protein [Caulobacteraceae bacterium]
MDRRVRAAASVAAGLLLGAGVAAAPTPSIVGLWSHRVVTAQGAVGVVWDEFGADGRLHVKIVNPILTMDYYGVYKLLNNGAVLRAQINDFTPRQMCTLVCSPTRPELPIGRPGDSPLRFDGPSVIYIGGDMYTREK